jgi:hypothetical protein
MIVGFQLTELVLVAAVTEKAVRDEDNAKALTDVA